MDYMKCLRNFKNTHLLCANAKDLTLKFCLQWKICYFYLDRSIKSRNSIFE